MRKRGQNASLQGCAKGLSGIVDCPCPKGLPTLAAGAKLKGEVTRRLGEVLVVRSFRCLRQAEHMSGSSVCKEEMPAF